MKTNDTEQVFTNLIKRNIINSFIVFRNKNYSELLKVYFTKKHSSNEIELEHTIEKRWDGSLEIYLTFKAGKIEEIVSFSFKRDCTIESRYHFSNYKEKNSGSYLIKTFIDDIIALIVKSIDVEDCYSVEVSNDLHKGEDDVKGLTNYLLDEVDLTPKEYLLMIDKEFK